MNFLNKETLNTLLQEFNGVYPQIAAIPEAWVSDTAVSASVELETETPDSKENTDAVLKLTLHVALITDFPLKTLDLQGGIVVTDPQKNGENSYTVQCMVEKVKEIPTVSTLYGVQGTETDNDATAVFELVKVGSITQEEISGLLNRCTEHERYGAIYNEDLVVTVLRAGVNAPAEHLTAAEKNQYEQLQETINQTSRTFPVLSWRVVKQSGVRDEYRIVWWERADVPHRRLVFGEIT